MSSFDQPSLTQDINGGLSSFRKALRKPDCTRLELKAAQAVCVCMDSGPALVCAAEALTAWDAMALA